MHPTTSCVLVPEGLWSLVGSSGLRIPLARANRAVQNERVDRRIVVRGCRRCRHRCRSRYSGDSGVPCGSWQLSRTLRLPSSLARHVRSWCMRRVVAAGRVTRGSGRPFSPAPAAANSTPGGVAGRRVGSKYPTSGTSRNGSLSPERVLVGRADGGGGPASRGGVRVIGETIGGRRRCHLFGVRRVALRAFAAGRRTVTSGDARP